MWFLFFYVYIYVCVCVYTTKRIFNVLTEVFKDHEQSSFFLLIMKIPCMVSAYMEVFTVLYHHVNQGQPVIR